jgi:hypothetical protein
MKSIVLIFLMCSPLLAASKSDYQDAVLVGSRMIAVGSSCSGDTNGKADDDGRISADTSSNCSNRYTALYTITLHDQTFTLRPAMTKKEVLTLGWSSMFKASVLHNQLPGSHVLIRSASDGVHVKVGKRESKYEVVEAR